MNPRRIGLAILASLALGLAGCVEPRPASLAQPITDTPDRHGEVYGGDTHPSGSPDAQIVLQARRRNTDGSAPGPADGLCVPTSLYNALVTQGYHAEAEALIAEAKRRPGGYGPDKLRRLIDDVCPHLRYVSIVGTSTEPLERLLRAGIPVSATLRTGKLYQGRPIHHFVNPVHLDANYSSWVDNNNEKVNSWGPRSLYDQRYLDGGTGWAVAFWPKRLASAGGLPAYMVITMGVAVGILIAMCVLFAWEILSTEEPEPCPST